MDRIRALREQGQSIWYRLHRTWHAAVRQLQTLVDEGDCRRHIESRRSFRMLSPAATPTSTIWQTLAAADESDAKAIYEALAIADIQTAADLLRAGLR